MGVADRKLMNYIVLGCAAFLTIVFVVAGWLAESVYEWNRGPIEAEIAVGQVRDDPDAYVATRMAASNFPTKIIWGGMFFAIVVVWVVAAIIWRFKLRVENF